GGASAYHGGLLAEQLVDLHAERGRRPCGCRNAGGRPGHSYRDGTFQAGTTVLATVALNGNGVGTFTTGAMAAIGGADQPNCSNTLYSGSSTNRQPSSHRLSCRPQLFTST